MYRYDSIDQQIVNDRVSQFRDQTERFLRGTLGEEEFRVLRLQNGLYIQKHACGDSVRAFIVQTGSHARAYCAHL
jgi:sulfite reductase beta subunit-like hemoprotein